MPFGREIDLKLIKLVEENPILYNTRHVSYLEPDKRELAWQNIGAALNKPALLCKTRWINIRDNMRRKIREREKKPNLILKKYHPSYKYRYEDALKFILPFFKGQLDQNDESNEAVTEDIDDATVEMPSQVFIDNDYDGQDIDVKPDISSLIEVNSNYEDNEANDATYIKAVSTSQGDKDPITVFLEVVDSTLRNLNPYYLNQAKSKIFQVVQECELQQIVNKGEQPSSIL